MSLPDMAEAWQRREPYLGPDYYHISGYDCGHRHLYTAKYVDDVNCRSCKKAIEKGYIHGLKSAEQHEIDIQKDKDNRLRQARANSIRKYPDSPVCVCGFAMVQRTNRKTGAKFYGCSQYPNCKNTTFMLSI